jgi:Cytochrome C oxidase, cbb3-type, subunit III
MRRKVSQNADRFVRLAMGLCSALAVVLASGPYARAQAADPADIAEGMRLFHHEADCQACHGWAGDGRKVDNQMPNGADLRASTIDRATLILTIKCGRPGAEMPAFDKFAYSDGRCYGLKQADLKARGLTLFDPPTTLQPRQIEEIADFLLAKVIGKGPLDHAKCVAFWGSDMELCKEFPR